MSTKFWELDQKYHPHSHFEGRETPVIRQENCET